MPVRDPRNALEALENVGRDELAPAARSLSDQTQAILRISNRVGEQEAVDAASQRATKDSEIDAATFERATRGFDLSARQQRGAGQRLGLSRSLARASRSGATRRGFRDRAKLADRAGSGLQDLLFQQRLGTQGDLAGDFTNRRIGDIRRNASKKSALFSTAGSVAGIALMLSSEKAKDKQGKVSGLLDKLKSIRVEKWNYKGDEDAHIGPFAEEFNDTFGVGQNHRGHISVIDAIGVTLGAVKEINERMTANGV